MPLTPMIRMNSSAATALRASPKASQGLMAAAATLLWPPCMHPGETSLAPLAVARTGFRTMGWGRWVTTTRCGPALKGGQDAGDIGRYTADSQCDRSKDGNCQTYHDHHESSGMHGS